MAAAGAIVGFEGWWVTRRRVGRGELGVEGQLQEEAAAVSGYRLVAC